MFWRIGDSQLRDTKPPSITAATVNPDRTRSLQTALPTPLGDGPVLTITPEAPRAASVDFIFHLEAGRLRHRHCSAVSTKDWATVLQRNKADQSMTLARMLTRRKAAAVWRLRNA
ncbi:hypothetical protein AF72_12935 [Xylella taiwanensis]|uniref:Uncharacterized protein n=1 Tax=Xylella taiwanensis TaxID=1444770 RepID=Z9JH33_9GAMM|nr:hypothetical protein AB672_10865 [Xylella taiwanensis]EWS77027.1 hypothetical protein AF72_12935 [Xylella taiwanensis]